MDGLLRKGTVNEDIMTKLNEHPETQPMGKPSVVRGMR